MAIVSWLEIPLSSTVTRRSALAGYDIVYEGNTYINDGLLVDVEKTTRVLSLENTPQEVIISLVDKNGNTDVRDAIRAATYRHRIATLYKGNWDEGGNLLTDVVILKQGPLETANDLDDDGTVTMIISSPLVATQRSTENVAQSTLHNQRIKDGVYGTSVADRARVDKMFDLTSDSFDNVRFGKFSKIEATYKKKKTGLFGLGKKIKTLTNPEKPARAGVTVNSEDSGYQPAKVYGRSLAEAHICNAWNPTPLAVGTIYTGNNYGWLADIYADSEGNFTNVIGGIVPPADVEWYGDRFPESVKGVEGQTRYLTIQYVVAVAPIDKLEIHFENLAYDNESVEKVFRFKSPDAANINDVSRGIIHSSSPNGDYVSGIVEVQWGGDDQPANYESLWSNQGNTSQFHRGIGHIIVTCTYEATREGGMFSGGFPTPSFTCIARDTRKWGAVGSESVVSLANDFTTPLAPVEFLTRTSNSCSLGWGQGFSAAQNVGVGVNWQTAGNCVEMTVSNTDRDILIARYGFTTAITEVSPDRYGTQGGILELTQGAASCHAHIGRVIRPTGTTNTFRFLLANVFASNDPTVSLRSVGTYDSTLSTTFAIHTATAPSERQLLTTTASNTLFPYVLADYLVDTRAGAGIDPEVLDLDTFDAALGALRVPTKANGVMQGRASYFDYVEDIGESAGLTTYEERGRIKLYHRKNITSSDIQHQFTVDNSISIKTIGQRNSDKFNRFTLTYGEYVDEKDKDPSLNQKPLTVRDNEYLAADLLQDSEGTIDAPFLATFFVENSQGTITYDTAFDGSPVMEELNEYADFLLDRSRLSDDVEVTVPYESAKNLDLGQPFSVNTEKYGWTGLDERIFIATEIIDDHKGMITITGQQHTNALLGGLDEYPEVVVEEIEPSYVPYTGTNLPPLPQAPDSLTAIFDDEDRVVNITWPEPTDGPVGEYELQVRTDEQNAVYQTIVKTTSLGYTYQVGDALQALSFRLKTVAGVKSAAVASLAVGVPARQNFTVRVSSPDGDVFKNNQGSKVLTAELLSSGAPVTDPTTLAGLTYKWKYLDQFVYVTLPAGGDPDQTVHLVAGPLGNPSVDPAQGGTIANPDDPASTLGNVQGRQLTVDANAITLFAYLTCELSGTPT